MQIAVNNKQFIFRLLIASTLIMAPLYVMLALKWPRAHDFTLYAGILSDFSQQFWQGQLYPRWLMRVYEGYGSPIFYYYSPLAFFALTPLEFLSGFDPYGLWRAAIDMQLALIAGGITSYRWLGHHFDTRKAQTGAMLYASFPYFPILIYYNYGLASLWAIAFFPLVLEGMDRLRTDGWLGVPRLSFGLALVCLSHVLTLITFMVVPLTYALGMAASGQRFKQSVQVGAAGIMAVALCAVYVLPMQLGQSFINPERFTTEVGSYAEHFWMIHSLFGFLCFVPPLIGLYCEQPRDAARYVTGRSVRYWVLVMLFLVFIISPLSRWLWDSLTFMHYMQFPMRFYTGMWPAAVFLAACWLPQAKTRSIYTFLLAVMLINVTVNAWDTWFNHSAPAKDAQTIVTLNNNPVYFPRWVEEPLPRLFASEQGQASVVEGSGEVSVLQWSAGKISLRAVITSDTARVVLHQFYFPYWQSPGHETLPYHGFLSVVLGKGTHEISISGQTLQAERLGMWISAASLALLVLFQIISATKIRALRE